jgi:hypothetical protein
VFPSRVLLAKGRRSAWAESVRIARMQYQADARGLFSVLQLQEVPANSALAGQAVDASQTPEQIATGRQSCSIS